jgi:hypothetical protein
MHSDFSEVGIPKFIISFADEEVKSLPSSCLENNKTNYTKSQGYRKQDGNECLNG